MNTGSRWLGRYPLMAGMALALIATLTLGMQAASQGVPGPPKPGAACKTKGERLPGGFVCVKKKGKLVWSA